MSTNYCMLNLLKVICLLQKNSEKNRFSNHRCDYPFLGNKYSGLFYNTRVLSFYKRDGSLFSTNYFENNSNIQSSSVFRLMNIDDDSATLLILSYDGTNYTSTNQFLTIDLKCICAIRCIDDVIVNNI